MSKLNFHPLHVISLTVGLLCLYSLPVCSAEELSDLRFSSISRVRQKIAGVPESGGVCMRSLNPRPRNARDPHDTIKAIKGFHVTRLEWTYGSSPAFIKKLHDMGIMYGGAMGAGSYDGDKPRETWNIVDIDSKLLFAPWMSKWSRPNSWGCANNPEFRAGHLRRAIKLVKNGVDVIQRDEPSQNRSACSWGGCYCDYCMNAFRQWLAANADLKVLKQLGINDLRSFDYREYAKQKKATTGNKSKKSRNDKLKKYFSTFQYDTSVKFHKWWRTELDKAAGRHVPISCNNGTTLWGAIQLVFDYAIGELHSSRANPTNLFEMAKRADLFNKAQAVTMPINRKTTSTADCIRHIRQTMATTYALGMHMEMPWDTYLPSLKALRFFGMPANYADLTGMVRAKSKYFDGYYSAFVTGKHIKDKRWGKKSDPLVITDGTGKVFASVRAVPQDSDAPLVVHFVEWADVPKPFNVSLDPVAMFGDRVVKISLITPKKYVKADHDKAEQYKNYSTLINTTLLAKGKINNLKLPALTPWGIIVIEPAVEKTKTLYAPTIRTDSELIDNTKVTINSIAGNKVYYTLDGSVPTKNSLEYKTPLLINKPTVFKAVCINGKLKSAVTSRKFTKVGTALLVSGKILPGINFEYFQTLCKCTQKESAREKCLDCWRSLDKFRELKPVRRGLCADFDFSFDHKKRRRWGNFGYRFSGLIKIAKSGLYTFTVKSDDGALLSIDSQEVVKNEGLGRHERKLVIPLQAGFHAVKLDFFEGYGGQHLKVFYSGPNLNRQIIPPAVLFHTGK